MSAAVGPVCLSRSIQAEALAGVLRELGFTATVLKTLGHQWHPCVVADSGPAREVRAAGLVYAAPDDRGEWWFWLADRCNPVDVTRVAALSEVSLAAGEVDRALTRSRAAFPLAR